MALLSPVVKEYLKKLGKRPTKLTEEMTKKLEDASAVDASVTEVCYYCEISRKTYYKWMGKFPQLLERLNALREKTVLSARQEVAKGLIGNPMFSMTYLKSKRPDEFTEGKTKHENVTPEYTETPESKAIKDKYENEMRELLIKKVKDKEKKENEDKKRETTNLGSSQENKPRL